MEQPRVMRVLSTMQLFFTDDYLVIDPTRQQVIDHTQYLFIQSERPLCSLDKVDFVKILERRETHKEVTTVYIKVGLVVRKNAFISIHEATLGKKDSLKLGTDGEQVIALAVAIAGACGTRVQYPRSFAPSRQRQP